MKVQLQSVHFDADRKLVDFIQNKLDKLEKFFDRIIDAEVILKLEKSGDRENKIVEIKLNIPGNQLFAKENDKSFEAATDSAVEAVRRQLKKYKEKMYS
jgi:putative sigma-54 modulation protein